MFAKMHQVASAIIYGMPKEYIWMKISILLKVPNIKVLWLQKPGEKKNTLVLAFSVLSEEPRLASI